MSQPVPPAPVIGYATAMMTPSIRQMWLLWVARVAGALPLTVGILTLLAFLVHPMPELMSLGIWTIVLGTGMVAVGFVCVLVYCFMNQVKDRELRRRVNRQTGWAILLMVINFPAAWVCIMVAIEVRHRLH